MVGGGIRGGITRRTILSSSSSSTTSSSSLSSSLASSPSRFSPSSTSTTESTAGTARPIPAEAGSSRAGSNNNGSASSSGPPSSNDSTNSSSIPIWYPILGGFVLTVLGGFKYAYDYVGSFEGLYRSIYFYSYAIPKYIEYRYYMIHPKLKDNDIAWNELHERTSKLGLEIIIQLKGFYIKCGQICSCNIGNAFPTIWQDTMSILQDQVPYYENYDVIRTIIESELKQLQKENIIDNNNNNNNKKPNNNIDNDNDDDGNATTTTTTTTTTTRIDFDDLFLWFDPIPIGSASIGQVHRAILNDEHKTNVVVKVRYPNVERLLRGDVRTIRFFAEFAQPVHVPALIEIEKQFMTEFDYIQEAKQLQQVYDNLHRANLCPTKCYIPRPILQYCTRQMLIMEELKGDKIVIALRKDIEQQAKRSGYQSVDEYINEHKQKQKQQQQEEGEDDKKEEQQKQQVGPTSEQYAMYRTWLDGQRRIRNLYSWFYNTVVASWIPGTSKEQYLNHDDVLPLNHAKLVDDLIYIHGHEILVDGYFNGDPHPGNILLCPQQDGGGDPKLGLIDYGQVKQLTKEQRHLFCHLIIALDDDDKRTIVKLMKDIGFKSKFMNDDIIYLYAKVSYDQDNMQLTNGMHIQMFMEYIETIDPIIQLPQDYIMISRTSLILRGLAHALHQSRSMAKQWRSIAEYVLKYDI